MTEQFDWNMVMALTGIMSLAMAAIGTLILAAAKSMFITKKDNIATLAAIKALSDEINKKLYDSKNITIFMPREECEKCRVEIKALTATIVSREEWEKSKAYRERRMDENQRIVCSKIDKITKSVVDMQKEQNDTNELLGELRGSFDTYLELVKKNQNNV